MGNFWKKYKWYIIAIVVVLILIGIWQWNRSQKAKKEAEAAKKKAENTPTYEKHPVPPGDTYVFKVGIEGDEVTALQKALNNSKKLSNLLMTDGKFGPLTAEALKAVTGSDTITYVNLVKLKEQYK